MTIVKEPRAFTGSEFRDVKEYPGPPATCRALVVGCAVVAVAGLTAWLWEDLAANSAVYVVGDSITYLSESSISADFSECRVSADHQRDARA